MRLVLTRAVVLAALALSPASRRPPRAGRSRTPQRRRRREGAGGSRKPPRPRRTQPAPAAPPASPPPSRRPPGRPGMRSGSARTSPMRPPRRARRGRRRSSADLQEQVQQTIADLEVREAALKAVLAKRDDALKRAARHLVGIFAKMKPDAAAAQLSALDDETAAAVLQQLNPRAASAILDEITPRPRGPARQHDRGQRTRRRKEIMIRIGAGLLAGPPARRLRGISSPRSAGRPRWRRSAPACSPKIDPASPNSFPGAAAHQRHLAVGRQPRQPVPRPARQPRRRRASR